MYEFSLCLTKICKHNYSHWWILRAFHHVLLFLFGLYFGSFRCGRNFFRPTVYCFLKVGNAPLSS